MSHSNRTFNLSWRILKRWTQKEFKEYPDCSTLPCSHLTQKVFAKKKTRVVYSILVCLLKTNEMFPRRHSHFCSTTEIPWPWIQDPKLTAQMCVDGFWFFFFFSSIINKKLGKLSCETNFCANLKTFSLNTSAWADKQRSSEWETKAQQLRLNKKIRKRRPGSDLLISPDESDVHVTTQVVTERFITTWSFYIWWGERGSNSRPQDHSHS